MKTTLRNLLLVPLVALALTACKRESDFTAAATTGDYAVQPWQLFAGPGSMAPDLRSTADGRLLLSWLSRQEGRRNALQFASYTEAGACGWLEDRGLPSQWPGDRGKRKRCRGGLVHGGGRCAVAADRA